MATNDTDLTASLRVRNFTSLNGKIDQENILRSAAGYADVDATDCDVYKSDQNKPSQRLGICQFVLDKGEVERKGTALYALYFNKVDIVDALV